MREGYYQPRPLPRKPFYPGSNVSKEPPKDPHKINPNNNGKKNKTPNILVIGLIALVLLIAIIILLIKIFGGNSGSKKSVYNVEDLEMKISNAFVDGNSLNVVVDVISDDSSLESFKFIMEGYGKQEIFLEDYVPNSMGENKFSFNLKNMELEEVTKISVTPVIKDKKGNIITGSVKDTYSFYYKPTPTNDDNDDDYNVPYDSYWNSSSNNNSLGNCTSNHTSKCYNGNVYWYDSCDKLGGLKDDCNSTEICLVGTCVASGNPPGPVNPGCGNNIIESKEYCDGTNLGGETCASFGFSLGILKCNGYCTFDLSSCYNNGQSPPSQTPSCTLTSVSSCYQGNVWFYDSCGQPAQVKDYCTFQEECVSNECKTKSTNLPPPPLPPPIPQ